ncbi:hypothetical protein FM042_08730 [Aliidiomarina halalkaliphila]|uniref:Uncharacterized protein n=1 Tax=Aliidiomarina halalkaliphila TaxID=2593535 RepID=A0A552WZL0_9GAMM|nr:hypothetical protein [Aliidiomarina halalkaliphila]TRW48261.1 hypothetical protein FM042_08730 [Aliidiomarina halalkaliphila]
MRWIALVVFLVTLAGCATTSQYERDLTQITTHYASLDAIWPGYRPSERILGVYDSSGVVVATGRSHVSGFERLDSGLWRLHDPNLRLQGAFYINYELNGERMTLVRRQDRSDLVSFLIHEDFHGYQRSAFANHGGSTLSAADIGEMPAEQLLASIRLERNLLISALEAPTELDRIRALAAYIALREWRNEQLPESFRGTEDRTERIEGSAHWVELNAEARVQNRDNIQERLRNSLNRDIETQTGNLANALLTHRLYPTGASLLELAQELQAKDWQGRIEAGSTPYQLIREHINLGPEQLQEFQEDLLNSAVFEREVERAGRIELGQSGQDLYEALRQRYRHEVRFYIPDNINEEGERVGRSSLSMQQAAPFSQGLAMDPVDQFTYEGPNVEIHVTRSPFVLWRTPFLNEQGEEVPGLSFSIFTSRVIIDGERAGSGEYQMTPDNIRIRGLQMQGEQPIRLEIR